MHEETETTYNERVWVPVRSPIPDPEGDGLLIVNLVKKPSGSRGTPYKLNA